jgi:hypothetical protein
MSQCFHVYTGKHFVRACGSLLLVVHVARLEAIFILYLFENKFPLY